MKTKEQKNIITIDGPAASGKSSVSRGLARLLGWSWVSTGAFYRAIGFMAYKKGVDENDEGALLKLVQKRKLDIRTTPLQTQVFFDGEMCAYKDIYSDENGVRASNVSRFEKVRSFVLDYQRACYQDPGLVAEGRDCGTVIFPQAPLKIYLVADSRARAKRRANEHDSEVEAVAQSLKSRDHQDKTRTVVPLKAAREAQVLDTSDMSLEEVVQSIYKEAKAIFSL